MRRNLLILMAAALFSLGTLAAPAQACLWDRETNSREIEFKAQYPTRSNSDETSGHDRPTVLQYLLMGTGGLLGTGGLGLGLATGIAMLRKPI